MEVLHARCAGLDVHFRCVNACVRIAEGRKATTEHREFATTTAGLIALASWLTEAGCTHVATEATGVYWKPVWHIFEDKSSLTLGARQRAAHPERSGPQERPERGLDRRPVGARADSGQLCAAGPDPGTARPDADPQAATREIGRHTQRLQKTLEDANVKLTRVVTRHPGRQRPGRS